MSLRRRKIRPKSRADDMNNMDNDGKRHEHDSLTEAEKEYHGNVGRIKDQRGGQWLANMKDGTQAWLESDASSDSTIKHIASKPKL